eukprot:s1879_g14.t1
MGRSWPSFQALQPFRLPFDRPRPGEMRRGSPWPFARALAGCKRLTFRPLQQRLGIDDGAVEWHWTRSPYREDAGCGMALDQTDISRAPEAVVVLDPTAISRAPEAAEWAWT